jgi:hypothetical protein
MTNKNVLDFILLEKRVVNMEYRATRIAENKVYTLVV